MVSEHFDGNRILRFPFFVEEKILLSVTGWINVKALYANQR